MCWSSRYQCLSQASLTQSPSCTAVDSTQQQCDKIYNNNCFSSLQLFTSGAYVNASQVSVEVLKALNLVEKPSSHKDKNKPSSHKHEKKPEKKPESHKKEDKPTSQKHEGKQNDKKSDNGDWSSADYKTKSPVSGLLAILYLEEFELWLIRAKTPEDLNDIIVRVSHVEGGVPWQALPEKVAFPLTQHAQGGKLGAISSSPTMPSRPLMGCHSLVKAVCGLSLHNVRPIQLFAAYCHPVV